MAPKRDWKPGVKRYIALLRQELDVERVILFGSYARGDQKPYSDIDLAIFSRKFKAKNEIKDMQYLFKKTCGIDTSIEPHPYHPRDLKNPQRGTLLYEIVRTGKVIV